MELDGSARPMAIHHMFEETDYGARLASAIRYDYYKPDNVSNERWVEILGADVNNLTHLPLTLGLTKRYIDYQDRVDPRYFSGQDRELLMVAAITHDWAEAVVGDIRWDDKSDSDQTKEMAAFDRILIELYSEDANLAARKIQLAKEQIIFDDESEMGKIFNAIERAGYLRTALRATRRVIAGTAPDCEPQLKWLAYDVFGNQVRKLLKYAKTYEPIRAFMANQIDSITEAFAWLDGLDLSDHGISLSFDEDSAFQAAKLAWQAWVETPQAA